MNVKNILKKKKLNTNSVSIVKLQVYGTTVTFIAHLCDYICLIKFNNHKVYGHQIAEAEVWTVWWNHLHVHGPWNTTVDIPERYHNRAIRHWTYRGANVCTHRKLQQCNFLTLFSCYIFLLYIFFFKRMILNT